MYQRPGQAIFAKAGQWIYFEQKLAQWLFYQREAQWPFYHQAQWPFYQSRSKRMARPSNFRNKLQFRYYPAQSIY